MIITFNQMPTQITINSITGLPPFNIYLNSSIVDMIYIATISSTPYTFDVPAILENLSEGILKIVDSNGCIIYENVSFIPPVPVNYLAEKCCPSTLYWTLPDDTLTDLSEATPIGDCEDFSGTFRELRDSLRYCYCNVSDESCITDDFSYELQPCGRKAIKRLGDTSIWWVDNGDNTFSTYYIYQQSGDWVIEKDTDCCSESFILDLTDNDEVVESCGSFTGNGLFDWYNRSVIEFELSEDYLFYPYYDSETNQCMFTGDSTQEVVTIYSNYDVLNKVIKGDNGIYYNIISIVTSASTITWTPPTIYNDCEECTITEEFIPTGCEITTEYCNSTETKVISPIKINLFGYDFLDDINVVPTRCPELRHYLKCPESEDISQEFRGQLDIYYNYQSDYNDYFRIGRISAAESISVQLPPSMVNENVSYYKGPNNNGWKQFNTLQGCSCKKIFEDEGLTGPQYDFEIVYLTEVQSYVDLPLSGQFGQRCYVIDDGIFYYWNPNTSIWVDDYELITGYPDQEFCASSQRDREIDYNSNLFQFNSSHKLFTWYSFYLPFYQIYKYKI